ncbi:MAG: cupin domain-containing protein [Hyphomicrobiaceae bacterium]|nr:cupin domain-containing protein [Hyphomicrobiaceae bacterium]
MPMTVIDHASQPKDPWRAGVLTRMVASSVTGTSQLAVFEQWCDPGLGAPTHLHAVEEILTVLEGEAEVWLEAERRRVTAGQSVVVPAGRKHGFINSGTGLLRVQAILASPVFEAAYDDARETPRRWLPGPA